MSGDYRCVNEVRMGVSPHNLARVNHFEIY